MGAQAAQTAEYLAATGAAAFVDLSSRQQLVVTGEDRVTFLHGMVTNDINGLAEGASCQVAMLTAKGAMVGEGRVLKRHDALIVDTGAGFGGAVHDFLQKYLISEDAEVVLSEQFCVVGLLGPDAETWLKRVPADAVVARLPGLLGGGVDLLINRDALEAVKAALAPIPHLSEATFEVLRVEAGVPRFGVDMSETTIPLEANLEKAIHYNKGCYIGQEVIARATYRGQMNKKLVGVLLGDAAPEKGTELRLADKRVGRIMSVVLSGLKQQHIGLAYVHRDHLAAGTTLDVATGGTAVISALPFHAG